MTSVRQRLGDRLEWGIARTLPFIIGRSLRRDLHAVWAQGDWDSLPEGGAVIAANHHSWWDAYLVWFLKTRLRRRSSALMNAAQLARFRFFRSLGAVSETEVRVALRRLEGGDLLFIFPEGELRQAGGTEVIQPGATFFAQHAAVPLYPLAIRVVMRGAQYPEAFLSLGLPLPPGTSSESLRGALNRTVYAVDRAVATSPAEAPPEGFELWLRGRGSTSTRLAWVERLWS